MDATELHLETDDLGTIGALANAWLPAAGVEGGRRRAGLQACADWLGGLGICGVALVAPWLDGPHARDVPGALRVETAGVMDGPVVAARVARWLEGAPEPGERPRAFHIDNAVLVDFCIGGHRTAVGWVRGEWTRQDPLVLPPLPLGGMLLVIAGMLRADRWRVAQERLVQALALAPPATHRGVLTSPQEAVAHAAAAAHRRVCAVADGLGYPLVGIHLSDPDDALVWDLALSVGKVAARHGGVTTKMSTTAPFDWLAHEVMAPCGGGAQVRRIPDRTTLDRMGADVGLSTENIVPEGVPDAVRAELGHGPWTLARRPLHPRLSPSRRNLLLVLHHGRSARRWQRAGHGSPDADLRIAALARSVGDEVERALLEGMDHWQDDLREALLTAVERGPAAVCETLQAGISAARVSLWRCDGPALHCVGAAGHRSTPPPFALDQELLDPRESGLLHHALFPERAAVSEEGFLGWAPLAAGRAVDNVGTVPLSRAGRPWGLIRMDGVRALFASHVRTPGVGRLCPPRVPLHARDALGSLARWLAPLVSTPDQPLPDPLNWTVFRAAVTAGRLDRDAVAQVLRQLAQQAPTRSEAAVLLGIHRNTLARHLDGLAQAFGADVLPWP